MSSFIIIAVLVTIGVTALLISLLMRVNGQGPQRRRRDDGGDSGVGVYAADGGAGRSTRADDANDSGADAGGGDGGGGGGGGD